MKTCKAPWLPLVLVALIGPGAGAAPGPDAEPERIARIESAILPALIVEGEPPDVQSLAERMERLGVPGVSIAVIDGGEIAWAGGWGLADVMEGSPVTAETMFQAASISKPVAALAALALVERGAIDLDADVNEKLTSWMVPENEHTRAAPVTLRRLLNHTAGLTVHGFPGYVSTLEVPLAAGVLDGAGNTPEIRVDVTPGTIWRYSGGGYVVMQQLVEDVSGVPFARFAAMTVLEPLGMDDSTYQQPLPSTLHHRAATGYRRGGVPVLGRWHVYPELAAAGLWTTPTDLARSLVAIQRAQRTGEHPVLSGDMVNVMMEPGLNQWGLGPSIDEDRTRFGHGGSNMGFRCGMTAFVGGDRGVVVMTNSDTGGTLVHEIFLTIAREYGWPGPKPEVRVRARLEPEVLDAIAGVYRGPPGGARLVHRDGRILAHVDWMTEGEPFEFIPESRWTFFAREDGLSGRFVWSDEGSVTALSVRGVEFKRVE